MDELTTRLEALFRRYGKPRAGLTAPDDETLDQFRAEVRLLIAEYGHAAVDAAIEAIPHDRSFALH